MGVVGIHTDTYSNIVGAQVVGAIVKVDRSNRGRSRWGIGGSTIGTQGSVSMT